MMKRLTKGILVIMCLALLSVPAAAFDMGDHVYQAPNGIGDVLIYPVYFADQGVETKFGVINTSSKVCVVAKVIVRSYRYSQELLDFLIYLSPNDEFVCTLKYDGGKYVMETSDDSLCDITGEVPTVYELTPPDCEDDSVAEGYIEVIEAWSTVNAEILCPDSATDPGTVDKSWIFETYAGIGSVGRFDTADVLSGFAELTFAGFDYLVYQPTVLAEYDNLEKMAIFGLETRLGTNARNNLCEVEAALSKNNLVIPYYDSAAGATFPIITFPTKLSNCDGESDSPYFDPDDPTYVMHKYDLEEHEKTSHCTHSPCDVTTYSLPYEVNLLLVDSYYEEGWGRLTFNKTGNTSCRTEGDSYLCYTGAPAIGLIAEFTAEGLALLPPAYDFGTVAVNDATECNIVNDEVPCYQLGGTVN